jgi:hypothetical protein
LASYTTEPNQHKLHAADIAIAIENIISKLKRRDWTTMDDVQKEMQNAIDDYLLEAHDTYGINFTTVDMDTIIEQCLSIAKKLSGK